MQTGGRVAKRLAWYWQVEVGNALLIPAFVVFAVRAYGDGVEWPTMVALLPVIGLLVIGGLYWRGKLNQLRGDASALDPALALADRAQRGLLVLTALALALGIGAFILTIPGSDAVNRWAALIASLLALAEYVNYYHRQLQHFDNWADFKRLLTGKGFRPAKMAVDLAAWRAARAGQQGA